MPMVLSANMRARPIRLGLSRKAASAPVTASMAIYRVNSLHVRQIRYDADSMRPVQVVPAMREHLEFLHALAARDSDGAISQMMAHIERSKHRVLAGMLRAGQSEGG